MDRDKKAAVFTKMISCSELLKLFTKQLQNIENDLQLEVNEKQNQIKIIKDEISKVGAEIDIIKKEVKLINSYTIN